MLYLTTLTGCGIDRNNFVGDIIVSGYTDKSDDGIIKYNPATGEFENLVPGVYYDVQYNADKSKILCERHVKNEAKWDSEICEYDIKSKEFSEAIEDSEKDSGEFRFRIRYVPNSDDISYVLGDAVHICDRSSGTLSKLVEVGFYWYSWDKSGKKLLYGDYDEKIYIYDVENSEKKQILEGRYPIYSNNNEYIAYQGKDNKLTVYNINTKEEWKSISVGSNQSFIFSPDDRYILLATEYKDIVNAEHYKMYIVDYKTGKKMKLFNGDGGKPGFDWR